MKEGQDIGPWPHQRNTGKPWTSVLSLGTVKSLPAMLSGGFPGPF